MKRFIALTALAVATASTLVLADAGAPGGHRGAMLERLKAADTNGDGMISKSEAAALPRLAAHFDAIDANHDGQVTFDELQAYHQAQRAAHGKALGKALLGPNGQVTRDEFLQKAGARFDRMDANHDGVVTADEMHAAFKGHGHGAAQ